MDPVRRALPDLPGTAESFGWPVTRAQALAALDDFVQHRLAPFGSPRGCHVVRRAARAVEAFERQLFGWREFVRGVCWPEGPSYADRNPLGADGSLPQLQVLRVLHGDVLIRHRSSLGANRRMARILRGVAAMPHEARVQIRFDAALVRRRAGVEAASAPARRAASRAGCPVDVPDGRTAPVAARRTASHGRHR